MKLHPAVFLALMAASEQVSAEPDLGSFPLGPFEATPNLEIKEVYNDNLFRQPNARQSSIISSLSPGISLVADHSYRVFTLRYAGDYAVFHSSQADNYVDHSFSASARLKLSDRNHLNWNGSHERGHADRGSGLSEGMNVLTRKKPDTFARSTLSSTWEYGNNRSILNLDVHLRHLDLEYQNNRRFTQVRDRSVTEISSRLTGRTSEVNRLFGELRFGRIIYKMRPELVSRLDSTETELSFGTRWDLTAKTIGELQFGYLSKNFRAGDRNDGGYISWKGEISWFPREYSELSLSSSRRSTETNGNGNFLILSQIALHWSHEWTMSLKTQAGLGFTSTDFEASGRADEGFNWSINATYDFKEWVSLSVGYSFAERSSSIESFNFDRSRFSLSARLHL